jgi:hypothetical protein
VDWNIVDHLPKARIVPFLCVSRVAWTEHDSLILQNVNEDNLLILQNVSPINCPFCEHSIEISKPNHWETFLFCVFI